MENFFLDKKILPI